MKNFQKIKYLYTIHFGFDIYPKFSFNKFFAKYLILFMTFYV